MLQCKIESYLKNLIIGSGLVYH